MKQERPLVLIVDDDPNIAKLLASLFEEEGYIVAIAGDGVSALQQIKAKVPEFVMADVMMPRMDGVTLARQIAATWESIPVVLMSAADRPTGIDVPFIQKPFDLEDVLSTVDQLNQDSAK